MGLHQEVEAARLLKQQLGDILAADPEFLPDALEGETSLFEALDALVASIVDDEALAAGVGRLIDGLKARKQRIEDRADSKRALVATALEVAEVKKRECPAGTVSLRAVPPKVIVTDEASVPARFWKQPAPVLDKKELLAALKERDEIIKTAGVGPDIPGATLSNGSRSISIRS